MNKVALVTGSSKGLGSSIIKRLANENYNVVITYKDSREEAYLLEEKLKKYNIETLVIKCDISEEVEVKNMIAIIKERFGKLDILINNAAISIDNDFMSKTKEEFLKVLSVNLIGTFLVIKHALNIMDKGVIINIASTDGIDTYNSYSIDYCASKAGVINMTKNLALELNDIKICAVAPNWINTETILNMNQDYLNSEMKRIGQKKLIDKDKLASFIIKIIKEDKYKSGDIIVVRDGSDV